MKVLDPAGHTQMTSSMIYSAVWQGGKSYIKREGGRESEYSRVSRSQNKCRNLRQEYANKYRRSTHDRCDEKPAHNWQEDL